jgi:hypothetical protein
VLIDPTASEASLGAFFSIGSVHRTLNSNAYAFSIDDKAAFKSVPSAPGTSSNELIITIGGAKGLINNKQAPLPTAKNFATYCH